MRKQCEEVIDLVWGRNGWSADDFCNMGEEAVETLEDFGGLVEMSNNAPR
jgi:hypothetical protein